MLTRTFHGLCFPILGLGAMRLPTCGPDTSKIDDGKAQDIIDYAYENGIRYFDTAYMYHDGDSERFLGEALRKYDRSTLLIASKMPIWMADTPQDMERIFSEQLDRLQTEYIDFYLFHSLNRENFDKCVRFGLYDFLMEKKRQGKIRYLGFSFHDKPAMLEEICQTYSWDFAQLQLNYLDWTMQDAKTQYDILERYHLPCVVMEPVRGGMLANLWEEANSLFLQEEPERSVASWAIRFAANLPNVMMVLSGMSNLEQLQDNIQTLTGFTSLTERERNVIEHAVALFQKNHTIPCTGCRYCMECPQGVEIPKLFRLYNDYAFHHNLDAFRRQYSDLPEQERAERCVSCQLCASHCPQAIAIPEQLTKIRDLLRE